MQDLKQSVSALKWYHTIDLGGGLLTPGIYDHRPYLERYGLPDDLRGKTALDVGAASGFFSFEMERRGADVTAVDLGEWMAHDFGPEYVPDMTPDEARGYLRDAFLLARDALGSKVERRALSVYDLWPESVGVFDLVFCGSLLLHLKDPVRALERLRGVTAGGGMAIIATAIDPDPSPEPRAAFVGSERGAAWWSPNRACLEKMVRSAGYRRTEWVSTFVLDERDGTPGTLHGVIKAYP